MMLWTNVPNTCQGGALSDDAGAVQAGDMGGLVV